MFLSIWAENINANGEADTQIFINSTNMLPSNSDIADVLISARVYLAETTLACH